MSGKRAKNRKRLSRRGRRGDDGRRYVGRYRYAAAGTNTERPIGRRLSEEHEQQHGQHCSVVIQAAVGRDRAVIERRRSA
jgi:hypothetical protein